MNNPYITCKMAEEGTTTKVEELLNVRGQLEREIQYMSASLGQLKEVSDRFSDNTALLQNYQEIPAGKLVMVPLTASMFVSGQLKDPSRVMVDLGTGYFAEKSVKEAEEYYQRRIAFIHQQMDKVEHSLDTKKVQFQACSMQINASVKK